MSLLSNITEQVSTYLQESIPEVVINLNAYNPHIIKVCNVISSLLPTEIQKSWPLGNPRGPLQKELNTLIIIPVGLGVICSVQMTSACYQGKWMKAGKYFLLTAIYGVFTTCLLYRFDC